MSTQGDAIGGSPRQWQSDTRCLCSPLRNSDRTDISPSIRNQSDLLWPRRVPLCTALAFQLPGRTSGLQYKARIPPSTPGWSSWRSGRPRKEQPRRCLADTARRWGAR
eukprot:2341408-Prymnesium_polylepis.3